METVGLEVSDAELELDTAGIAELELDAFKFKVAAISFCLSCIATSAFLLSTIKLDSYIN